MLTLYEQALCCPNLSVLFALHCRPKHQDVYASHGPLNLTYESGLPQVSDGLLKSVAWLPEPFALGDHVQAACRAIAA